MKPFTSKCVIVLIFFYLRKQKQLWWFSRRNSKIKREFNSTLLVTLKSKHNSRHWCKRTVTILSREVEGRTYCHDQSNMVVKLANKCFWSKISVRWSKTFLIWSKQSCFPALKCVCARGPQLGTFHFTTKFPKLFPRKTFTIHTFLHLLAVIQLPASCS